MNTDILTALIGAGGTIIGAIIGALLARTDFFDRLFKGSKFLSLVGKWKSTWEDYNYPNNAYKELLVIERQKGSNIYGYITMEDKPDKKWNFEGNFSGRFLQLFYFPSKEAEDKLFLDYGCYFFEMQGNGAFKGYSIGFDYEANSMGVSTHRIERIR
ncbi:MAG: hypothetical protein HZA49_06840 [Planctomycetes bacterium]|nr:hypothetical protein [Planctomycetota bacterium]